MLNKYIFGLLFGGDGNMLFPDWANAYYGDARQNHPYTLTEDAFIVAPGPSEPTTLVINDKRVSDLFPDGYADIDLCFYAKKGTKFYYTTYASNTVILIVPLLDNGGG